MVSIQNAMGDLLQAGIIVNGGIFIYSNMTPFPDWFDK
jgi:hypothetical protein